MRTLDSYFQHFLSKWNVFTILCISSSSNLKLLRFELHRCLKCIRISVSPINSKSHVLTLQKIHFCLFNSENAQIIPDWTTRSIWFFQGKGYKDPRVLLMFLNGALWITRAGVPSQGTFFPVYFLWWEFPFEKFTTKGNSPKWSVAIRNMQERISPSEGELPLELID